MPNKRMIGGITKMSGFSLFAFESDPLLLSIRGVSSWCLEEEGFVATLPAPPPLRASTSLCATSGIHAYGCEPHCGGSTPSS